MVLLRIKNAHSQPSCSRSIDVSMGKAWLKGIPCTAEFLLYSTFSRVKSTICEQPDSLLDRRSTEELHAQFRSLPLQRARPNRFDTLLTCVSTGTVGFLALNSNNTSAVLGPTPGSCNSSSLASSRGFDKICARLPLYFLSIILETCCIARALLWYRPATFKQFSICLISASARVSGVIRNLFERFSKAPAVFLSLVFCEMIVAINVAKGLRVAVVHVAIVNVVLKYSEDRFGTRVSHYGAPCFESNK